MIEEGRNLSENEYYMIKTDKNLLFLSFFLGFHKMCLERLYKLVYFSFIFIVISFITIPRPKIVVAHHHDDGGVGGVETLLAAGILAKLLRHHHQHHGHHHPVPIPIPVPVHHEGHHHHLLVHGHHGR